MLVALGRLPSALVACASAIESALKSAQCIPPSKFVSARTLYATARNCGGSVATFSDAELGEFRDTRNAFVHYGFHARDHEKAATLLLKTGIPFVRACYSQFFDFDLTKGLVIEYGQQLDIATATYEKVRRIAGTSCARCFSAFSHLILWSLRQSLMSDWELHTVARAEERGVAFERSEATKDELDRLFGTTWPFDCPVCGALETFVCELDVGSLQVGRITVKRAACTNCDLLVVEIPYLASALIDTQITVKRREILREYGLLGEDE